MNIKVDGKYSYLLEEHNSIIHLGVFNNPIDAAKAYNQKAIELFGEYTTLNAV